MSLAEPQTAMPKPKVRWFHLTPDQFVVGLLVVEMVLWLAFDQNLLWKVIE